MLSRPAEAETSGVWTSKAYSLSDGAESVLSTELGGTASGEVGARGVTFHVLRYCMIQMVSQLKTAAWYRSREKVRFGRVPGETYAVIQTRSQIVGTLLTTSK